MVLHEVILDGNGYNEGIFGDLERVDFGGCQKSGFWMV